MHRTRRSADARRVLVGLAAGLVLALSVPASAHAGRVFIDPGHGGPYPGAVQGGVSEKSVNLLLGLAVRDALAARGHQVAMSRTTDVSPNLRDIPTWHYVSSSVRYYADSLTGVYKYDPNQTGAIPYDDLQARCDMANRWGADVFVSIHCDSSTSTSARGTATYRNWDNETDRILSGRLAELVQSEMIAETAPYYNVKNNGVKVVGFYVVRWSNMPAVLVESAFLSNSYERSLLLTPLFRWRLANGIADGIGRFLAEDPFQPVWPRLYGETRYGTAAAVAADGWPSGAGTVLLASGQNWPDALAATPLSTRLGAPLLLTRRDRLPDETRDALAALSPAEIVVLGGHAAVSSDVATAAAGAAGIDLGSVRRIAGRDRYETAALIGDEVGVGESGRVVLVSGVSYADALSVSAYAGDAGEPILLTERSTLPAATESFLVRWDRYIRRAWVIGGTAAVSESLARDLSEGNLAPDPMTIGRKGGVDRYDTNRIILNSFWSAGTVRPYVATANSYPDALSAGTLAARRGEPVMLVGGRFMSGYTREFLVNEEARISAIRIVGGPATIPRLTDWQIRKGLAR